MVKKSIILALTVFSANTSLAQFNADSLKQRLSNSQKEKQNTEARLRASQSDAKSLRMLNRQDILYKLPNGEYVPGLILPNEKIAPAFIDRARTAHPACVTKSFKIIKGIWDKEKQAIKCDLKASELAVISNEQAGEQLANETTRKTNNEPAPKADKYGKPKTHTASKPARNKTSTTTASNNSSSYKKPVKPIAPVNPNRYVPPPRNSANSTSVAGVMQRDPTKFGVSIGTWIKGRLPRTVSSSESGMIEFITTEDIEGKYQTLPKGTVLFANKTINTSEKKLESMSVLAKTPDGLEIPNVSVRVYSLDQTAGLSGQIVRDREAEIKGSASNAALNVATSLAPAAGNVAGAAVNSVANDMARNEKRFIDSSAKAFIRVSPQNVLLKVSRSF